MAKINIDKLVADLLLIYCDRKGIDRNYAQTVLDDALNKQNLKCVDGNIVSNEPKFKKGDLITNGDYMWQITKVLTYEYELISPLGNFVKYDIDHVDEYFHLWTLRDAKDRDILVDTHKLTDEYKAGYRDGKIDCLNKILKYVEVNCPYFSVTYGKELEKLIKNE